MDAVVSSTPARLAQGIATGCLKWSRLAFGATVILIPFRMRLVLWSQSIDPIYHDYTDVILFASDLFLLMTLTLWVVNLAILPRRLKVGPRFLLVPLVGVTAFAALSIFSSFDPFISLYNFIRMILLNALFLYILNEVALDQLVLPVALQISVQAVVGVAQVLQQHSLGLNGFQELELNPAWSGISIVLADGIRSLRAYGLTDHPNILGGCFAFGLLLIGAWYAGSKMQQHALLPVVFALCALGLLVTFSRAAWVALASGLVFCIVMFFVTRQREPILRWLGLAAAALVLLLPFIWHNLPYLGVRLNANDAFTQVTLENRSISERDYLVQGTLRILSEHPLLGVGVGALPQAQRIYYPNPDVFGANYQPAHFVLLDVAAETGLVGALFYLGLMAAPWLALCWNRKRLTFTPALVGVSGVLLAVTLVGFFDYYTWLLAPGRLWQWLVWGVWGIVYSDSLLGAQHV